MGHRTCDAWRGRVSPTTLASCRFVDEFFIPFRTVKKWCRSVMGFGRTVAKLPSALFLRNGADVTCVDCIGFCFIRLSLCHRNDLLSVGWNVLLSDVCLSLFYIFVFCRCRLAVRASIFVDPAQPTHRKQEFRTHIRPNPTRGSTQPADNSVLT